MSDLPFPRKRFIEALIRIAAAENSDEELTANLRVAILYFASETPDNLNCAEHVEIGSVGDETGLKLQSRELLLSDIAHAIEDMPVPEALKAAFPGLSADDWEAFTRLTTLIYILLNRSSSSQH